MGSWSLDYLLQWLGAFPGHLALVADDSGESVTRFLAQHLKISVCAAGRALMFPKPPGSPDDLVDALSQAGVLVGELDLLYWHPWLMADPLRVMSAVARRSPPKIFVWPGEIEKGVARYSRPGRPDFFERKLTDAVVLRPLPTPPRFPDEPPYRMERFQ